MRRAVLPDPMPDTQAPASQATDHVAIHATLIAVRQAAELLCDRAILLILLHAQAGACRYAEFSEQTRLPSRLLSARLQRLCDDGLLVKIPYSRRPLRHAYHLTHMGVGLFEVMGLLVSWEQAWPEGDTLNTTVQVRHFACAGTARAGGARLRLHCAHCAGALNAREVGLRVSQTEMARMPAKSTTTRRSSQPPHLRENGAAPVLPQALAVLGDKWSIEVLVCAFFGLRQFGDFGPRMGIATNILANRLTRLVQTGLLRRSGDEDPHRKGAYLLTPKGQAFYPILVAIQSWADAWIDHRVRSPVKLQHRPCQTPLATRLVCAECEQGLTYAQGRIELEPGSTGP